jgi:hypothetical protein
MGIKNKKNIFAEEVITVQPMTLLFAQVFKHFYFGYGTKKKERTILLDIENVKIYQRYRDLEIDEDFLDGYYAYPSAY